MRRLGPVLTLALGLLAAPAWAVDAPAPETGPSLRPAGSAAWPQRAFRLQLPERRGVAEGDVEVLENGERVDGVTVRSAEGAGSEAFGSVLVVDASSSMHRGAIDAAMAAARELAAQRRGAQRLGVVVFNRRARVLLAPTADQAAIDRALARPPALDDQTRIFDAVTVALDLLRASGVTAGSIVVLSDGADTGSRVSGARVARRARTANVVLHTVGLRSNAFDPGELRGLAATGRGSYAAAGSPRDLRRIFRRIGAELASDFLVAYRSPLPAGRAVTVAVRLRGTRDVAVASYVAPGGASFVRVQDTFWTSSAGLWGTGAAAGGLVLFALVMVLTRRRRPRTLQERVRSFVTDDEVRGRDLGLALPLPTRPLGVLERSRGWDRLLRDLDIAQLDAKPGLLVLAGLGGGIGLSVLLVAVSGLAALAVAGLLVPWGTWQWVQVMVARRRRLFSEQLPEVLQGAASAVRAGSGLVAAISMVAEEAPEPARSELGRVMADEALGVPLDVALRTAEQRMASRDVLQIALVAQIQRDAGGNTAEVLDRICEALRQRGELRRMVSALTAQGRLSRWVVSLLPVGLLLVIATVAPDYVRPLFEEPLGLAMLAGALGLMTLGSIVIGRIVDFEV